MFPFGFWGWGGNMFPYTNFHDMNLDWIIWQVKHNKDSIEQFRGELEQMGVDIEEFRQYIDSIDSEIQQKVEEEVPTYIQQSINNGLLSQVVEATRTRRVIIIGDSYGAGWTPDGDVTGFPVVIKNLLHISNDNFFNLNKGGARFGASQGNEFAFDTVLEQLIPNITNKDTITDIIFAGGYNEGGSSYDTINEGIARCKSLIGLNFHNPSLRVYLFAVGYHCTNPNQRNLLYNRYKFCYSKAGWAYGHLTPSICWSEWWASDGYHPLQPAQNAIAQNIIGIMMGGIDIGTPVVQEYANTDAGSEITYFTSMGKEGLTSFLYGTQINFATPITLNRTTPAKILTITSKLPICNKSDMSLLNKIQASVIIETNGSHYETHTLTFQMLQNGRDTFELYALMLATNAEGNNYLELTNVSAIQFLSNSIRFVAPYEF